MQVLEGFGGPTRSEGNRSGRIASGRESTNPSRTRRICESPTSGDAGDRQDVTTRANSLAHGTRRKRLRIRS